MAAELEDKISSQTHNVEKEMKDLEECKKAQLGGTQGNAVDRVP